MISAKFKVLDSQVSKVKVYARVIAYHGQISETLNKLSEQLELKFIIAGCFYAGHNNDITT